MLVVVAAADTSGQALLQYPRASFQFQLALGEPEAQITVHRRQTVRRLHFQGLLLLLPKVAVVVLLFLTFLVVLELAAAVARGISRLVALATQGAMAVTVLAKQIKLFKVEVAAVVQAEMEEMQPMELVAMAAQELVPALPAHLSLMAAVAAVEHGQELLALQ